MHVRRLARRTFLAALTGALLVSAAWAGAGLAPAPDGATAAAAPGPNVIKYQVGAAKVSITPNPNAWGGVWETEGCATLGGDAGLETFMHVPDFRVRWPEKPNCIYMGGYGIGPMNPITSVHPEYGLWVRSIAVGDGKDTVVLTVIDGTSYFGDYNEMCRRCGAFELAQRLGAELDQPAANFLFHSTHSHTAPDFIGGWGGVPEWYMKQVEKALLTSVRNAVKAMTPAVIEAGEVLARGYNGERRDFYRSAEDNALTWFRAYRPGTTTTIATVGAYAAHPVTADEGGGVGNPDFPGVFDVTVEERFGGVGLFFQSGLGNVSPRGSTESMGEGLAAMVPALGAGTPIPFGEVRAAQAFWQQPVTNSGLTALGVPGFFDRPFAQTPAVVEAGENSNRPCRSASAVSVNTAVSAVRIGNLTITGAPGETFSNLSNTVEEKTPGPAMALAQINDGLGYIMQSFETDHAGRQILGFVGDPLAEYEDAYSIDHCFGDKALEETLRLVGQLYS